jgi:hypothetical protein
LFCWNQVWEEQGSHKFLFINLIFIIMRTIEKDGKFVAEKKENAGRYTYLKTNVFGRKVRYNADGTIADLWPAKRRLTNYRWKNSRTLHSSTSNLS